MQHFLEFAASFWALGERVENVRLYEADFPECLESDLRAELCRWDRDAEVWFARKYRASRKGRRAGNMKFGDWLSIDDMNEEIERIAESVAV